MTSNTKSEADKHKTRQRLRLNTIRNTSVAEQVGFTGLLGRKSTLQGELWASQEEDIRRIRENLLERIWACVRCFKED